MGNFKKYFTIEEANRTLPLVKRIVRDILDTGYEARSLITILGDDAEKNAEVQQLIDKIQDYFAELEEIGCYYKDWDFSLGLVDFPAILNGQEVFLCWRSDEPEILFYHEIEAGYMGRKPIPSLNKIEPNKN